MKPVITLLLAFFTLTVYCQNSTVPANTIKTDKITSFKTQRVEIASKTLFNDTTFVTKPVVFWDDTATQLTDFSLYDGVLGSSSAPMPMVYMDCHSNGHFNSCYISVTLAAGNSYTLPIAPGKTATGSIFITGLNDFTFFGIGHDAAITLVGNNGSIGWTNANTSNLHCLYDNGTTAIVRNNTSAGHEYHIQINYVR